MNFSIFLAISVIFSTSYSQTDNNENPPIKKNRCVQCHSRAKIRLKYGSSTMNCGNPFNQFFEGSLSCLAGPSTDILNQINYDYEDNWGVTPIGNTCETEKSCYFRSQKEQIKVNPNDNKTFGEDSEDYYIYTVDRGCVYNEEIEKFKENECESKKFLEKCEVCEGELCNTQVSCVGAAGAAGRVKVELAVSSIIFAVVVFNFVE